MPLLERDHELAELRAAAASAAAGTGSTIVVSGEAGIGKSSLLAAWMQDPGTDARILVGWCDDFLTSRTLGPLRDIARGTGGRLADAVAGVDTAAVLDALLAELHYPLQPTVLVIEDLHWADDATLDVLRFVGRRIDGLPAVLVMTYRDDDLAVDHPLHGVLGALPTPARRLTLRPLSPAAVRVLVADRGVDADEVLRITDGNPFFVSEITHHGAAELPTSVADAVLGRVTTLPAASRAAVDLLSVIPGRADHGLVARLGLRPDDLGIVESRGLLAVDATGVRFRHELTRLAVRAALPVTQRIQHHQAVLSALGDGDDETAILHHALEVGRGDVVAAHGPRVAHEAYIAGAHREAVRHQTNVLIYAHLLEPEVLAGLLEQHAWTLYTLHRFDESVRAAERAVAHREALGDPVALGRALTVLARMRYVANDPEAAIDAVERAVDLLAAYGNEEERAEGLVARAVTYALIEEPAELARQLAEECVAVTDQLGRPDLRSLALNYRAISQCAAGGQPDIEDFHEAIRLALDHGHLELAARAYANLTFELMLSREPNAGAVPTLDDALAFLQDHDFASHAFDVLARKATVQFVLGNWGEAERQLRELRATTEQHGLIDLIALESLARIAIRRGDEDADAMLSGAWGLARRSGAAPYIGLIGVIRLEQAWLAGDRDAAEARLADLPLPRLRPRLRAEALRYGQLAGVMVHAAGDEAEPWCSGLRGDWRAAAAAWERDGRPYEQALELLASGQQAPMLRALEIFDGLGAVPAARLARQRLRSLGVRSIPRGPQAATRHHPAGLTPRQAEVLDLLADGLTNAKIADRLVVSVRTVDHHVAAVLQKLGVASRHEAADRVGAVDAGWR